MKRDIIRNYLLKITLPLIATFIFHSLAGAELIKKDTLTLTIENAIQVAVGNNKSIQMQEANIRVASANKLDAISNFLPRAETDYSYTYNDAIYSIPATQSLRKDPRIFQGYESDNLFSISVEQDFLTGGGNVANFKRSNLELSYQRETLRATVLETEFETKRLFYGLLLAYEVDRIARDLVAQAQAHYEETLAKYNQGTASKFDLLQSKVQVSRVIPQLIHAENSIDIIMADFKKLLALNMRQKVVIEGELDTKPIAIEEDSFLAEAYLRRPEMKLKLLGVSIEKWGIEFAKSTGAPQLSGTFQYYARSNDVSNMINKRHDNWNIGLKASIPIFDGLSTPAKVNAARAKYAYARLDEEDYVDQMAVDVKQACVDLRQAQAIINAQKDSIVEAKEALRLSEVRFITGVGINLDVFDSQVALAQVEQSLAEAIYDYIMAKAELDKVMGREYFREE